jgi:hypothetical protein
VPLLGRHIVGGPANPAADAWDVVFCSVPDGHVVRGLLLTEVTRFDERAAAFIGRAINLPIFTNGGDIIVSWDNGPNRIFALPGAANEWDTVEAAVSELLTASTGVSFATDRPSGLRGERKGEVSA